MSAATGRQIPIYRLSLWRTDSGLWRHFSHEFSHKHKKSILPQDALYHSRFKTTDWRIFAAFSLFLCYTIRDKRINTDHAGSPSACLSGASISVRSGIRKSRCKSAATAITVTPSRVKSECLLFCARKRLLGKGEFVQIYSAAKQSADFLRTPKGAFILSF